MKEIPEEFHQMGFEVALSHEQVVQAVGILYHMAHTWKEGITKDREQTLEELGRCSWFAYAQIFNGYADDTLSDES